MKEPTDQERYGCFIALARFGLAGLAIRILYFRTLGTLDAAMGTIYLFSLAFLLIRKNELKKKGEKDEND